MHASPHARIVLRSLAITTAAVSAFVVIAQAGLLGIDGANVLHDINTANGSPSNPRTVGNKVNSIALSPTGILYGVSQGTPSDFPPGGNLYKIHIPTGVPTLIATMDMFITSEGDIACDPISGLLYAVNSPGELFKIDTATGVGTAVGNIGTTLDLSAMAFDATGTLWVVDSFGPTLLKVDKTNASILDTVPLDPVNQEVGGLAFHSGGTLFFAGGTTSKLYTLNTTSGAALTLGPIAVSGGIWGLTFVPDPTPVQSSTWGGVKALLP
jgi:hypothetical protein